MWRWIKAGFLAVLALVLLSIGLANRDPVELRLMHTEISAFAGFNYSITLPLYLIVFLCIGFGVMIGFVWEWIRESRMRAEASRQRGEARQLKRQVDDLRAKKAKDEGKDEVLALLEEAGPAG